MSLETLLEAAEFIEWRSKEEEPYNFHPYAKKAATELVKLEKVDSSNSYEFDEEEEDLTRERRRPGGAGTREVHNKLEKNRRAHLKECFNFLKKSIPSLEDRRTSNLGILRGSLRYIQTLRRKEREHESEMQKLASEKIGLQGKIQALKGELQKMNIEVDLNAWMHAHAADNESHSTSTATEGATPPPSDHGDDDDEEEADLLAMETSPSPIPKVITKRLPSVRELLNNGTSPKVVDAIQGLMAANKVTQNSVRPLLPHPEKQSSSLTTDIPQTVTIKTTAGQIIIPKQIKIPLNFTLPPGGAVTTLQSNIGQQATFIPQSNITPPSNIIAQLNNQPAVSQQKSVSQQMSAPKQTSVPQQISLAQLADLQQQVLSSIQQHTLSGVQQQTSAAQLANGSQQSSVTQQANIPQQSRLSQLANIAQQTGISQQASNTQSTSMAQLANIRQDTAGAQQQTNGLQQTNTQQPSSAPAQLANINQQTSLTHLASLANHQMTNNSQQTKVTQASSVSQTTTNQQLTGNLPTFVQHPPVKQFLHQTLKQRQALQKQSASVPLVVSAPLTAAKLKSPPLSKTPVAITMTTTSSLATKDTVSASPQTTPVKYIATPVSVVSTPLKTETSVSSSVNLMSVPLKLDTTVSSVNPESKTATSAPGSLSVPYYMATLPKLAHPILVTSLTAPTLAALVSTNTAATPITTVRSEAPTTLSVAMVTTTNSAPLLNMSQSSRNVPSSPLAAGLQVRPFLASNLLSAPFLPLIAHTIPQTSLSATPSSATVTTTVSGQFTTVPLMSLAQINPLTQIVSPMTVMSPGMQLGSAGLTQTQLNNMFATSPLLKQFSQIPVISPSLLPSGQVLGHQVIKPVVVVSVPNIATTSAMSLTTSNAVIKAD